VSVLTIVVSWLSGVSPTLSSSERDPGDFTD
jgi:hypothetical protein